MKNIYLLRHAKSSWDDESLDDFDRPLNKRGREAAQKMGKWLENWPGWGEQTGCPPQKVLVSPSVRTRETLAESKVGTVFPDAEIVFADAIYEASSNALRALLLTQLEDYDSVLLIGHNPGLEMLLLETDPKAIELMRNNKLFPSGAFCALEIEKMNFDEQRLDGRVVELVRPKDIS